MSRTQRSMMVFSTGCKPSLPPMISSQRLRMKSDFIDGVVEVQVHGVDIVAGRRRYLDDLPLQTLHQWAVLRFRVADDNIVIGDKEHVGDLTLCGEGFAGTGRAENQTVGVFQELAVYHDKIVGKSVQAAVQSFFPTLKQLLCGERHEDGNA